MQTNMWFCTIHVYWTKYLKGHLGSKVLGSFTPVIYEHLHFFIGNCFKILLLETIAWYLGIKFTHFRL